MQYAYLIYGPLGNDLQLSDIKEFKAVPGVILDFEFIDVRKFPLNICPIKIDEDYGYLRQRKSFSVYFNVLRCFRIVCVTVAEHFGVFVFSVVVC